MSYGESENHSPSHYEDKFSGRSLDDELDEEVEDSDAEKIVADLRQAHEDVKSKLSTDFNEKIDDIIGTMEIYFDSTNEAWQEKADELTEFLGDMYRSDEDVIEDRASDLNVLQKNTLELAKKKIH